MISEINTLANALIKTEKRCEKVLAKDSKKIKEYKKIIKNYEK